MRPDPDPVPFALPPAAVAVPAVDAVAAARLRWLAQEWSALAARLSALARDATTIGRVGQVLADHVEAVAAQLRAAARALMAVGFGDASGGRPR